MPTYCSKLHKYFSQLMLFSIAFLAMNQAMANPGLARQYNVSCSMCHIAFPKLNAFGQEFAGNGMRMDGWKTSATTDTGDERLNLLKTSSVAFRAQAFSQLRTADAVNSNGQQIVNGEMDIQAPYQLKMLSTAPLSDQLTYYFAAIMAEKGENGTIIIDDAWLQYDNAFNTGLGVTFGQFQLSDFMFPRETRLTFQDFLVFSMADITYERGGIVSTDVGPLSVSIGAANGNGTESQTYNLNSAGYKRPDRTFDNNRNKKLFGFLGTTVSGVDLGLFASAGNKQGQGDTQVFGFNFSGDISQKVFWFGQLLQANWNKVQDHSKTINDASWYGGFLGVDFIANDYWAYSLLYNYADANDLNDSGTVYEGINVNSITGTISYYLQRNVKAVLEVNYDLLPKDGKKDGIGHDT
ncbi:MAG: hypothetical protein R3240_12115, partial [Gammaproteobacteria bacterium]|nr:hypothetical protein [Gammaproteobacteria bacterium]